MDKGLVEAAATMWRGRARTNTTTIRAPSLKDSRRSGDTVAAYLRGSGILRAGHVVVNPQVSHLIVL